jgi:hypothetical protein
MSDFQLYHEQNKFEMMMIPALNQTNTLAPHYPNSEPAKYLLILFSVAFLEEKQQMPML